MTFDEVDQLVYQIPGWLWPREIHAIRHLIGMVRSIRHVEVGSYCGKSAFVTGNIMDIHGLHEGKARSLYCIDNFTMIPNKKWHQDVLLATVGEFHRNHKNVDVDIVNGTSIESARSFNAGELCSVYIDADHNYAECKADIETWTTKIRSGGLIFGHDYCPRHPGVMDAVNDTGHFSIFPDTRIWYRSVK